MLIFLPKPNSFNISNRVIYYSQQRKNKGVFVFFKKTDLIFDNI